MATDKLFHKLATTYSAAILKLLKIPDYDNYLASSFTFKELEDTQVGKELMEIGGMEMLRENLSDLITTKLGRPERAWFEQMNALNDIALLKNLYRAILHAKSRKQIKEAIDGALGNGKKTLMRGK